MCFPCQEDWQCALLEIDDPCKTTRSCPSEFDVDNALHPESCRRELIVRERLFGGSRNLLSGHKPHLLMATFNHDNSLKTSVEDAMTSRILGMHFEKRYWTPPVCVNRSNCGLRFRRAAGDRSRKGLTCTVQKQEQDRGYILNHHTQDMVDTL